MPEVPALTNVTVYAPIFTHISVATWAGIRLCPQEARAVAEGAHRAAEAEGGAGLTGCITDGTPGHLHRLRRDHCGCIPITHVFAQQFLQHVFNKSYVRRDAAFVSLFESSPMSIFRTAPHTSFSWCPWSVSRRKNATILFPLRHHSQQCGVTPLPARLTQTEPD